MAHFGLWQDETMNTPATVIAFSRDLGQSNTAKQGRLWFGAKEAYLALQTVNNAGVDSVTLTPAVALPTIARQTAYNLGDELVLNGYQYKVITAGTTAANAPTYSTNLGDTVTDGTAAFQCVSQAHSPNELKLSLTNSGLSQAVAGAALQLGTLIQGGGGIEIWYEFLDSVDNVYSGQTPQLCLSLNECEEIQHIANP